MPIIELAEIGSSTRNSSSGSFHLITVDENTRNELGSTTTGHVDGYEPQNSNSFIRFDQGLDTDQISYQSAIDPDLVETQYVIEMDNRLGKLCDSNGVQASHSFLDDDNIATYYLTLGANPEYFENISNSTQTGSPLAGPRAHSLQFKVKATLELESSTFLFNQIGLTGTKPYTAGDNYQCIDSIVRVIGATTGYTVELPIRYIKLQS